MQRIATLISLSATLLVFSGCAGDGADRKPPGPIYATRRPEPPQTYIPPAPPPVKATPAPVQKPVEQPVNVNLDTASLIPRGGIARGKWSVISVHHSEKANATPQGMHSYHLNDRGWDNGLGYHLVIGNGIGYPDGQVYVGPRWKKQQTGAHTAAGAGSYFGVKRPANFFNEHGIGICLIGNFEQSGPTPRQMATLQQLIAFLCAQTGVPPTRIYGHGEVTHKTQCPGRLMQSRIAGLRQSVARAIAYAGPVDEPDVAFALANGVEEFEAESCDAGPRLCLGPTSPAVSDRFAFCAGECISGVSVFRMASAADRSPQEREFETGVTNQQFSGLDGHVAFAAETNLDGRFLVSACGAECLRIAHGGVAEALDDVVDLNPRLRGGAALCHVDDDQSAIDGRVHLHPLP